jgi:hypothetical protein
MRAKPTILLAASLFACNGADPSPSPLPIAGNWTVSFTNVLDDAVVPCTIAPITLVLSQDTTVLAGSYTALDAACNGVPIVFLPAPSTASGNIDGTSIIIGLGATPPLLRLQGTATPTDSSGTPVVHLLDGTFTAPGGTLAGEWSASRP